MMLKKYPLVICLLLTGNARLWSQQEAQITQYNDHMLYYNPAFAGSKDCLSLTAMHRQQWIGIDGAPMTQVLGIHSPLKYQSLGAGLSVLHDRLGPLDQVWVSGSFSYSLRFKNESKLAFGLNAGMSIINVRLTELNAVDGSDPLLAKDIRGKVLPNLGLGVCYRSKHFFVGFSVPRVVESSSFANSIYFKDQRHYYFSAGGYIDVTEKLQIRPSTLMKVTENSPFALDGSVLFVLNKRLFFGANYRLKESVGCIFQIQASKQIKVGYSLDISTTRLSANNYGSHEFMLGYELHRNKEEKTQE